MCKNSLLLAVLILIIAGFANGADLYKVKVNSQFDANRLNSAGAVPVVSLLDGYIVLIGRLQAERLIGDELEMDILAKNITIDELALDLRHDRANADKYELLYEEGQIRLYLLNQDQVAQKTRLNSIMPIRNELMKIRYIEQSELNLKNLDQRIDLQSLIDMVSQDSIDAFSHQLETFGVRLVGTAAKNAARDWLASKFVDFGYDSLVIDSFVEIIDGSPTECQNVVAVKIGTVLPDHHVIVGGHYDAVAGSPGADDNGSGTCGVLEIARVLKDIETELTFVFILFDAEEEGLLGAHHYADEAFIRGDSIVYMLNMDMIAHFQNSNQANLYHGADVTYTNLWIDLADSLVGITGTDAGAASNSDHAAFTQYGYPATFVHEYIFSTVYHSSQDSTTYMNYEYMTDMVKASLATVYTVSETYIPGPSLIFDFPDGSPDYLIPETSQSFEVIITGFYGGVLVPGSPRIHLSLDGFEYIATPLTELTATRYEATIPAAPCGYHYYYYISAEEDSMGIYYSPDPSEPNDAIIASSETVVFYDNFETDQGWTVSGSVSDGQWDRGVPVGGGDRGDPPYDYDGSGSCYLTDNVDDNSDVDGGTTVLTSPVFDLTGGEGRIHYARWYSNSFGNAPYSDVMKVFISNNGGSSWTLAETVGPVDDASGGWIIHSFWVSHFVTPTDQMQVKFEASDLGDGSVVEAGVDDFLVTSYICGAGGPPVIVSDSLPEGMVGVFYSEQLEVTGGFGPKTWHDDFNNLDGTGLSLSETGLLSGSPLYTGVIPFTAVVEDIIGGSGEKFFMIQVGGPYTCGDANGDGEVNVADGVFIINFVFKGGPAPNPPEAGDANCDGEANVGDAVYIINYVFNGGPDPCCP